MVHLQGCERVLDSGDREVIRNPLAGRRRFAFPRLDHVDQPSESQSGIREQAVANRRFGRLVRIIGEVEQFGAVRQVVPGHPRVISEDGRADNHHKIMAPKHFTHRSNCSWQRALIERVIFRKRDALGERPHPNRRIEHFGKFDTRVPCLAACDVASVDEHGIAALVNDGAEIAQAVRIGCDPRGDPAENVASFDFLVPVIQWKRQENRSGWLLNGRRVGPHESAGYVRPGAAAHTPI